MASIEERLKRMESTGETVNRVVDIWAPQIGSLIRISRLLIDKAKARGEDVKEAEAELLEVEQRIDETQSIVDDYKTLRAAQRAAQE